MAYGPGWRVPFILRCGNAQAFLLPIGIAILAFSIAVDPITSTFAAQFSSTERACHQKITYHSRHSAE
jgi:hypothetical protein